jgi:hypothetical protein
VRLPKLFRTAPGGWTLFDAVMDLESGHWIARAENDDGRTLVGEVPAERGPELAERVCEMLVRYSQGRA